MVQVTRVFETQVITESDWIGASETCQLCSLEFAALKELAELGLLTARESGAGLQVPARALPRLRIAGALMRDLGLNTSGAALAVELLEAQRALERRIQELERLASGY